MINKQVLEGSTAVTVLEIQQGACNSCSPPSDADQSMQKDPSFLSKS